MFRADLDSLCPAENLLLDVPTIDWTFGGMFPDSANSTISSIAAPTEATNSDGATGID